MDSEFREDVLRCQIRKMHLCASSPTARSRRNAGTHDRSISQMIDIIKAIADVEDEELAALDHMEL